MVCLNISKQNTNVADNCESVMDTNNVNFVSLIKKGYRCLTDNCESQLQATNQKQVTLFIVSWKGYNVNQF